MIHVRRFLDKVSLAESKQTKDIVLPISDARSLRDEIAKLLSDYYNLHENQNTKSEVLNIEITGGKFK